MIPKPSPFGQGSGATRTCRQPAAARCFFLAVSQRRGSTSDVFIARIQHHDARAARRAAVGVVVAGEAFFHLGL
jgi:hypothetical protein